MLYFDTLANCVRPYYFNTKAKNYLSKKPVTEKPVFSNLQA